MIRMFERVGLQTNLVNTKAIVCTPVFIWGQYGAEAYKRRSTGERRNFWKRRITRISCEVCGAKMADSYMRHYMERAHGRVLPQVMDLYVGGGGMEV